MARGGLNWKGGKELPLFFCREVGRRSWKKIPAKVQSKSALSSPSLFSRYELGLDEVGGGKSRHCFSRVCTPSFSKERRLFRRGRKLVVERSGGGREMAQNGNGKTNIAAAARLGPKEEGGGIGDPMLTRVDVSPSLFRSGHLIWMGQLEGGEEKTSFRLQSKRQ